MLNGNDKDTSTPNCTLCSSKIKFADVGRLLNIIKMRMLG